MINEGSISQKYCSLSSINAKDVATCAAANENSSRGGRDSFLSGERKKKVPVTIRPVLYASRQLMPQATRGAHSSQFRQRGCSKCTPYIHTYLVQSSSLCRQICNRRKKSSARLANHFKPQSQLLAGKASARTATRAGKFGARAIAGDLTVLATTEELLACHWLARLTGNRTAELLHHLLH